MSIDKNNLQLPQKSTGDDFYTMIRAIISTIPIGGGPVVELFGSIVTPPLEKRKNEWMISVANALLELDHDKRIDLAELASNPQFIDTVIETTRIALRTSRTEKLSALRNAVLNSALQTEPDETIHEILLNLIDALTPAHIEFLRQFAACKGHSTAYEGGFVHMLPVLKDSPLLYRTIWKDLHDRDLIEADAVLPTETKRTIFCDVSELGMRLLRFINIDVPQ